MNDQCEWIFDPRPPAGIIAGGSVLDQVFARKIDTFVRETTQNSNDQRSKGSTDPVKIDFHVHTISGAHLDKALDAIGWSQFRQHLDVVSAETTLRQTRYRKAGDEVIGLPGERKEARFLVISDFNTKGLIGGEFERSDNYAPLVRHQLVTNNEGATDRGGSYGVGKSVLWAFSDISTVFFHSKFKVDPDRANTQTRFIGRAILSSHEIGNDKWQSDGLFGKRETVDNGDCAISLEISDQHPLIALGLFPSRNANDQTGTSILIPFFSAPGSQDQDSARELVDSIRKSLNLWFWPILNSGTLEVTISHSVNGVLDVRDSADGLDGVEPFVRAMNISDADLKDKAESDDEVTERLVALTIPARRDIPGSSEITCQARLRVIREDDIVAEKSSVALIRGAGMVVKYLRPPGLGADLPNFYGVLEAGKRLGSDAANTEMETFLRAAEPIAHDNWFGNTDRVTNLYKSGTVKRLESFKSEIGVKVRDSLQVQAKDAEDGPADLSRYFSIGGEDTKPSVSASVSSAVLDSSSNTWKITTSLSVGVESVRSGWCAEVAVLIASEFGSGTQIALTGATEIAGAEMSGAVLSQNGSKYVANVPPGFRTVKLELVAQIRDSDIDTQYVDRTGVQVAVSLKPLNGGA